MYVADDGMNKMWNKDSWKRLVTNNQGITLAHVRRGQSGNHVMLELNERFAKSTMKIDAVICRLQKL